jgi:hypothetical protein
VTRDEFMRVDHYMAVDMPYELLWAKIWRPNQGPDIDEEDAGESEGSVSVVNGQDGDEEDEVMLDQFDLEQNLNIGELAIDES